MSTEPIRIVCDSSEQAPFAFSGLSVEVLAGALKAGDYSVAGFERRVAVERDRFESELARLRGYDYAAVVVEALAVALRTGRYLGRLDSGAAWQSVLAFSMRYRMPFIFCADRADAETVTFDLLRHYARDRWRELQALGPMARTISNNSGQQVAERTP